MTFEQELYKKRMEIARETAIREGRVASVNEPDIIWQAEEEIHNESIRVDDFDPDAAYERHLEDRGWMDTFEEEDRMAGRY